MQVIFGILNTGYTRSLDKMTIQKKNLKTSTYQLPNFILRGLWTEIIGKEENVAI